MSEVRVERIQRSTPGLLILGISWRVFREDSTFCIQDLHPIEFYFSLKKILILKYTVISLRLREGRRRCTHGRGREAHPLARAYARDTSDETVSRSPFECSNLTSCLASETPGGGVLELESTVFESRWHATKSRD